MDKDVAQRLADLRSHRATQGEPQVPIIGNESRAQRAKMPGFDGRPARMTAVSKKHHVTAFEASCAPLESLLFTNRLLRPGEDKKVVDARVEAAYAYREDMQKAEIAGLGAQVISDANGGGGNRATLSEHKLFAMQSLGELKDSMGRQEYLLLERVVWKDEWVFNQPEPKNKPKSKAHARARKVAMEKSRAKTLDEIRMVLDLAAVHYGFAMPGEVRERWKRPSPRKRAAAAAAGHPPHQTKAAGQPARRT